MPLKYTPFLFTAALMCFISAGQAFCQSDDTIRELKKSPPATTSNTTSRETAEKSMLLDSIRRHRDSTAVFWFTGNFEKTGTPDLHPLDTSITGFENYDILYKTSRFFATLGNTGLSSLSLSPFPFLRETGFNYGIHTFDPYIYRYDSVKYYRVSKTYSELFYTQGAKRELNFHAIFSRNIYRSLNLGFDFRVASSPGAYLRQKSNHINGVITAQFFTKNKRYGIITNFAVNRLRNYENGGIRYDSLFEQNLESNRQVIPVNLSSAQNTIRETGLYLKHYFNLSRHRRNEKDTVTGKMIELGRFTHSFVYNRQTQTFSDGIADSSFFPPPLADSVKTYDSVRISMISNDLAWSNPTFNPGNKPRVMQLEAGIRQQYSEVWIRDAKKIFNQYIPHAAMDFNPFSSLRLRARGDYVLGDYNANDLSLRIILTTILGRKDKNGGTITLTGNYIFQKPGWFYEHYHGNFAQWDTSWKKQGLVSGGFRYTWKSVDAGVNLARISNYVYLDTAGYPQQCTSEFGYIQLYFNTDLDIWRFKLKAQLNYQTVQGSSILRLPVFTGNAGIYYTQVLFRRAATLQPGLNFYYNTPYFSDNYNPSLRSFQLQDIKETGDHLYMDIFINLKIQRARFFFIYQHFNAGFMKRNYYTTPFYPMPDATFKFGVAWRFHD